MVEEYREDPRPRRSGVTYRKVLWSLLRASEGKTVVFISLHKDSSLHAFRMAVDASRGKAHADFPRARIVFENGGLVDFHHTNSLDGRDERGRRVQAIVKDA